MKKIAIFFIIIIAIVSTVAYIYLNQIAKHNTAKKENAKFEIYTDKEISGMDLATIINKAVDSNNRNEIQKGKDGKYIDNKNNSINIDIKFIDDDVIYNIEKIYNGGIGQFVRFYGEINFKCNEVKYHETTGKVSYMLFEQVTQ